MQVSFDFDYLGEDGKKVFMREGEVLLLISKTNKDWWQVRERERERERERGERERQTATSNGPQGRFSLLTLTCKKERAKERRK